MSDVGVEVDVVAESGFGDVESVDLAGGEEGIRSDDGIDGGDGSGCGCAGAGNLSFDVTQGEASGLGREGLVVFELEFAGVQFEIALEMKGQEGCGLDL